MEEQEESVRMIWMIYIHTHRRNSQYIERSITSDKIEKEKSKITNARGGLTDIPHGLSVLTWCLCSVLLRYIYRVNTCIILASELKDFAAALIYILFTHTETRQNFNIYIYRIDSLLYYLLFPFLFSQHRMPFSNSFVFQITRVLFVCYIHPKVLHAFSYINPYIYIYIQEAL